MDMGTSIYFFHLRSSKLCFMPFSWSGDLEELSIKLLNKCLNVLLLLLS